ncbi:hypothetical protein L1049_019876 [Liquidambar formosana]|uniref:PGG domain-containing protein n=1 Tax=Liquidambar formosana TaxID=63359 RepID=A0AAP0X392_LIQFO
MDWKLFKAAASGDIDFLRQMELAHKLDFNQVTPQKNTVLHIAVNSGQKEFAKQVLGLCSSLLLKANAKGNSPLHIAASIGCLELVELLINSARTQINEDVESQEVDVLKELLRMANLEKKETALHVAVRNGHFGVVKLLTEADVGLLELVNNADQSPLFLAAVGGFSDIILHILENYPASPCGGKNGTNALHQAVINSHHGIMKILVERRRDMIKEADILKWTPLHYAAFGRDLEAVRLLLQFDNSGAYLSDKDEISPLHVAAFYGVVDVARELIQSSPYIWEMVDDKGRTALHVAVIGGREKMVKYMLEVLELVGLINEPDKEGNTPLHLAVAYKKYSIISILSRDRRVDKLATNNDFFTAYDLFISQEPKVDFAYSKVVYQLKHGARGLPFTQQWVDTKLRTKMKGEAVEKGESGSVTGSDQCPDKSEAVEKGKSASVNANDQGLDFSGKSTFDFQLVVAMLIATVTFAAAFSMPGGYNNSVGTDQGMANFIDRAAFKAFIIFDTTAFCFSVAIVHLLNGSFFVYKQRPSYVLLAFVFNFMALTSMALAFATDAKREELGGAVQVAHSPFQRTSPSLDSPATTAVAILDSVNGLVRGCSASDPFAKEVPEMQREKTERTRRQSTSMDGRRSFIITLCCIGLDPSRSSARQKSNIMDWKLFKAAASGDINFLCQTEAHKLNFNQVTPQQNTVLHIAVHSKQKEFAEKVLSLCPSLILKANVKGDTPLHVAARRRSLELAELLINGTKTLDEDVESQEVRVKDLLRMVNLEKEETALHVAVRNGQFGVVKAVYNTISLSK